MNHKKAIEESKRQLIMANLITKDVDLEYSILKNSQLSSPVNVPPQRTMVIECINRGISFENIVSKIDKRFFSTLIVKRLINKIVPGKIFFSTYGISIKKEHD